MKKGKRLLILLGIAVVFGAGAWLLNLNTQKQEAAKDATTDTEKAVLLTTDAESVTKLSFTHGDETIDLSKENDVWVYMSRDSFSLDTAKVDTMISDLKSVDAVRTVADTNDANADYGLTEPAMTIAVTDMDGNAQQILIGDKNATTGNYYAAVEGKAGIYTISSDLYNAYDITLLDLLTTEDYPTIDASAVTGVEWNDGQNSKTLQYYPDGNAAAYSSAFTWFETKQDGTLAPVNAETVSTFLDAATGVSYASTVADTKDDLAAYGLDNPALSITLHYTEEVAQSEAEAVMAEEAAAATVAPTATPTITPTAMPVSTPTMTATAAPTATPTAAPTATPTVKPTSAPTATPTARPTATTGASSGLTVAMAEAANAVPTEEITATPTAVPTATPEPMVTVERSITLYLGNADADGNVYMTHSKTSRVFKISSDTMTALMKLTAEDLRTNVPANLTLKDITGMTAALDGVTKTVTATAETTTSASGTATTKTVYQLDGKELKSTLFSLFVNKLKGIKAEAYTDQTVAESAAPLFSATFTQDRPGFETVSTAFYAYDASFDQAVTNGDATMLVNKRDVDTLKSYFDGLVATEPTPTPEATATPEPTVE
ncbi:MAG: DUF4340 domain-containing protein [Eubacteriales bacterium]|nr:DUF4340 domain-containing protein [Eubacteriales bacterium]